MITVETMQNRLEKLTETLNQYDRQQASTQMMFEQIAAVFCRFKEEAELLKSEQREAWLKVVQDTLQTLVGMLQPYLDPVSISEQQLIQILDDPSYFNAEDWSRAQRAKNQIQESLQTLIPIFFERPSVETSADKPSIEKKKPPPRPPNRSDWMKS